MEAQRQRVVAAGCRTRHSGDEVSQRLDAEGSRSVTHMSSMPSAFPGEEWPFLPISERKAWLGRARTEVCRQRGNSGQ